MVPTGASASEDAQKDFKLHSRARIIVVVLCVKKVNLLLEFNYFLIHLEFDSLEIFTVLCRQISVSLKTKDDLQSFHIEAS